MIIQYIANNIMAKRQRITFERVYETIDDYFAICLNGEQIKNAKGDFSTAGRNDTASTRKGVHILWVYLYIGESEFVEASIPYKDGEMDKALQVAKVFVKQALAATHAAE